MLLNIRIQWNAGTACVSECVLKTLACRGLRAGPSKINSGNVEESRSSWAIRLHGRQGCFRWIQEGFKGDFL